MPGTPNSLKLPKGSDPRSTDASNTVAALFGAPMRARSPARARPVGFGRHRPHARLEPQTPATDQGRDMRTAATSCFQSFLTPHQPLATSHCSSYSHAPRRAL